MPSIPRPKARARSCSNTAPITSSPSKATSPRCRKTSSGWCRSRRSLFFPEPLASTGPATTPREVRAASPTLAGSRERNKSRRETRTIQSGPITPEQAGFPLAAQAARLRREVDGQQPETVALLTSLPPARLSAVDWLGLNRAAWGIETGLHARLDVSRRDDQCRLRSANAVAVHGIFTRLANSLFMEWRSHQRKPHHKTTTDFAAHMAAEHAQRALRTVTARNPNLRTPS
jgi:hypothetical protein